MAEDKMIQKRSTRQERKIYDRAVEQAVKETKEMFPTFATDQDVFEKAIAFKERRLREILFAAPVPQVGALRILESKRPSHPPSNHIIERAGGLQGLVTPAKPPPVKPKARATPQAQTAALPSPPQHHDRLADDLLIGAKAIADELGFTAMQVYHLARKGGKTGLPIGRLGKTLIASRAKLRRALQNMS